MRQRQAADDRLEARIVIRQLTQISDLEARLRDVETPVLEHLGRQIEAMDGMPEFDQPAGVTTRPAGGVERHAGRARRQQLTDDGLLDRDHRVAGLVVGVRPDRVARGRVVLGSRLGRPQRGVVEHAAQL